MQLAGEVWLWIVDIGTDIYFAITVSHGLTIAIIVGIFLLQQTVAIILV